MCSAASAKDCRAFPIPTMPGTGAGSMSNSAALSRRRSSTIPTRFNTRLCLQRCVSKVLRSGEVDVLARNTTWTFDRDVALGLSFVGVNYYDGQGFMVRKNLGVNSSQELNNVSVCTNTGTTTELNAADFSYFSDDVVSPSVIVESARYRIHLRFRRSGGFSDFRCSCKRCSRRSAPALRR